jgi:SRSO17 transposase
MLKSNGRHLPHGWITGDDEMGRSSGFRRDLRVLGEPYLLAVPSNTGVRDLSSPDPSSGGRRPGSGSAFISAERWRAGVAEANWTRIEVRDGEKGPLALEIVKTRVVARTERNILDTTEELLVVTRWREADGKTKYDYHLSNARPDTSLDELARVVKAEHRVEDAIKRAKSEAGLSDYEVRTWAGWHHHQTLSLMATWFLIRETRRGKKYTQALTVPQVRILLDVQLRQACNRRYPGWALRSMKRKSKRRELARFYHYKRRNLLAPLRVTERK